MQTTHIDQYSVRTTAGETFSGEEHAIMAALVWKRFGWDVDAAAAAWSRLMGSSVPTGRFQELAQLGEDRVMRGIAKR